MRDDRFEWDDTKAARNARKHRVTFEEAREAFDDSDGVDEPDDDPDEDRWRRIGRSSSRVIVVIFAERDHRIRIISARKATRHEELSYNRQASP
jgi:uncharacterized protein